MPQTTRVTATVSCSSPTSPGVDTPSKEGPAVLCFSFSWDPVKAGKKPKMTYVCIPVDGLKPGPDGKDKKGSGDNGKELKEKAEKEAEKQGKAAGRAIYVKLVNANTIEVSSDDLTHVDAFCNLSKIRFAASTTGPANGKGPGGTATPPVVVPPPPKPPGGDWPRKTPAGRRKWQGELDKVQVVSANANGMVLGAFNDPQTAFLGIGQMVVGVDATDSCLLPGAAVNLLYIPFLYRPESPMAQVIEFAERLDAAGIDVALDGDIVVPVSLRLTGQRITTFGFISALDATGNQPPCPWSLVIPPEFPLPGHEMKTGAREAALQPVGTWMPTLAPVTMTGPTLPSVEQAPSTISMAPTPLPAGAVLPATGLVGFAEPAISVVRRVKPGLVSEVESREHSKPPCNDCGGSESP